MAIVTRGYGAAGPSDAALVDHVDAGVVVASRLQDNVINIEIDDAKPGAIATLDEYMADRGYQPIATPSIAIAAGVPGDFDFNALGTFDWVYPAVPSLAADKQGWHAKKVGGWLLQSFNWVNTGISTSATDARAWTITAAGTDDLNRNGLAGTVAMPGLNGPVLNCGFRAAVPCSPIARTLRWQGTMFNVRTVTTAQFSDPGIYAAQVFTQNTAPSTGADYRNEVTFSGPRGTWLIIDHVITLFQTGTTGNLYCGAMGVS